MSDGPYKISYMANSIQNLNFLFTLLRSISVSVALRTLSCCITFNEAILSKIPYKVGSDVVMWIWSAMELAIYVWGYKNKRNFGYHYLWMAPSCKTRSVRASDIA